MPRNDRNQKDRQDPLSGVSLPFAKGEEVEREPAAALGMVCRGSDEGEDSPLSAPAAELAQAVVSALERRPHSRETPRRPSERKRQSRRLGVTFSTPDVPERIRDLARKWELYAPDGRSPNVSAVVEFLLLPRLKAAEEGEVQPPGG